MSRAAGGRRPHCVQNSAINARDLARRPAPRAWLRSPHPSAGSASPAPPSAREQIPVTLVPMARAPRLHPRPRALPADASADISAVWPLPPQSASSACQIVLSPAQIEAQQEEVLRRKYGGLPSKRALLGKQSASIKRYFDSGEWMLACEGKQPADVLSASTASAIEALPKLYL